MHLSHWFELKQAGIDCSSPLKIWLIFVFFPLRRIPTTAYVAATEFQTAAAIASGAPDGYIDPFQATPSLSKVLYTLYRVIRRTTATGTSQKGAILIKRRQFSTIFDRFCHNLDNYTSHSEVTKATAIGTTSVCWSASCNCRRQAERVLTRAISKDLSHKFNSKQPITDAQLYKSSS